MAYMKGFWSFHVVAQATDVSPLGPEEPHGKVEDNNYDF